MPTIVTRGGASARGFGFAGATLNLTTQTFTSSTTWTAPVGVTNLVAVIGRGGSSTSDYIGGASANSASAGSAGSGSGPNSLPISASSVYGPVDTAASLLNNGGYSSFPVYSRTFTFYPNNTFSFSDSGGGSFGLYSVAGSWSVSGGPFSGNLGYGDSASYVAVGQAYYPGSAGGNTTAFGYTFSGASQVGSYPNATGQSATPVTYTNVAVTPGASYSVSVASGGSVVIQYLA